MITTNAFFRFAWFSGGKRRVSQCLFHEDDQTCAHGKWFDCEQLLNTDKEERRASVTGIDAPVAIDDTLDGTSL